MLLPIVLVVAGLGLLVWLAYAGPRLVRPHVAAGLQTLRDRREARRQLIRRNPLDYVRAFYARREARRERSRQRIGRAQAGVEAVEDRERTVLGGFPGGVEPTQGVVIVTTIMIVAWVASIVAHGFIELPIVSAISGGSLWFGILGTVLALLVPVVVSVLIARLWSRRGAQGMTPTLAAAVIGLLVLLVAVVAVLTFLAPIRAEIEYQDAIRLATQQITRFTEDGDTTALGYEQQHLAELQQQQARSAQWNQVLVPIAAFSEFATGFALPGAISLLLLRATRTRKSAARLLLTRAQNRDMRQQARELRTLSRHFQDAGVDQAQMAAARRTLIVEHEPPPPVQDVPPTPAQPGTVVQTGDGLTAPPTAPPAPDTPRGTRPGAPDDSFDLS